MKNKTKIIGIVLVVALLVLSMVSVSAESLIIPEPTLWEKIKAFFGGETFTIVGQDTQASVTPNQIFTVSSGASFSKFPSQTQAYCNGNSGLYDIFRTSGGVSNVPYYEAIDFVEFTCGTWNTECMVQLYCMPYVYPPTDSSCNSYSSGYTRVSNYDKTDPNAPMVDPTMPLYDFNTQKIITEYFYCKAPTQCTGADKTCWRKKADGTTCESATYDCSYSTYNTIVSSNCASGAGTYTFNSESSCTGQLTTLDRTCSANNGYWFYTAVQNCPGTIIPSSDTTTNCCSVPGTDIQNTTSQTCAQRNGFICPITSACFGTWLATADSQRCCNQQCTATTTCSSLGGLCIVPSAAPSGSTDLGQKDCLSSTTCIQVQDTPIVSTLSNAKKLSYTKEEIKTMTNNDLLAISCLSNSECFSINSNETTSCISLQQLRDEGIISQSQQDSFFDNAKSVLKTGAYSTIGSTVGCMLVYGSAALAFGPAAVVSVPAALGSCAIFGGLVGVSASTIQTAYYDITDNDELVSKLRASDANSVGLCVATEESALAKYTSWAAFFKITGDKGTDGLIIILGGVGLLALLFRR